MQKVTPQVVALWINHRFQRSAANPEDAILDVLVFGMHVPINPTLYPTQLRTDLERYLRRGGAYVSKRPPMGSGGEFKMVYSAQLSYETRLAAHSDSSGDAALAQDYVSKLRPCYEWEGFHDCPEHEAQFADEYLARNPTSPFARFLPLLAAHRWLCASEAYDYEGKPEEARRSRNFYEQRLSVARQSDLSLLRTAAERLATRARCIAPN